MSSLSITILQTVAYISSLQRLRRSSYYRTHSKNRSEPTRSKMYSSCRQCCSVRVSRKADIPVESVLGKPKRSRRSPSICRLKSAVCSLVYRMVFGSFFPEKQLIKEMAARETRHTGHRCMIGCEMLPPRCSWPVNMPGQSDDITIGQAGAYIGAK